MVLQLKHKRLESPTSNPTRPSVYSGHSRCGQHFRQLVHCEVLQGICKGLARYFSKVVAIGGYWLAGAFAKPVLENLLAKLWTMGARRHLPCLYIWLYRMLDLSRKANRACYWSVWGLKSRVWGLWKIVSTLHCYVPTFSVPFVVVVVFYFIFFPLALALWLLGSKSMLLIKFA